MVQMRMALLLLRLLAESGLPPLALAPERLGLQRMAQVC